jgi:hypothetical protein
VRSKEKAWEIARLFVEIQACAEGLRGRDAGIIDLFFAAELPLQKVANAFEMTSPQVARVIRDFLVNVLLRSRRLRQFLVRSSQTASLPEGVRLSAEGVSGQQRLAQFLIETSSTTDALGERVRDVIGTALALSTPVVSPALQAKVLAGAGFGDVPPGPNNRQARPRHERTDTGHQARQRQARRLYAERLRQEFERILQARESRKGERAAKLLYGPGPLTALSMPNPEFSVRFAQNHLRMLQQAVEGKLTGYESTPAQQAFHKVETVTWGLRCCDVAAGGEGYDEGVWVEPLARGIEEGKRLFRGECAGLVVDCVLECQDLLLQSHKPGIRKRTLQKAVRNLGKIVGIFGGSWEELLAQLQREQTARGSKEKRLGQLDEEIRRYGQTVVLSDISMIIPMWRHLGGVDLDNVRVTVPFNSPYCEPDSFIDVCKQMLERVGLKAQPHRINWGDNDAFAQALVLEGRPWRSIAEATGFGLRSFVERLPQRAFMLGCDRFLRNCTAPAAMLREGASSSVVDYTPDRLPAAVAEAVLGFPSIYEMGIEMSDAPGTLEKVVGAVAVLGCNIIASSTWTIKRGVLAGFRAAIELPATTEWQKFEDALRQKLVSFAELGDHRVIYASSSCS